METWTCAWCRVEELSLFLPANWVGAHMSGSTRNFCSTTCLYAAFADLKEKVGVI